MPHTPTVVKKRRGHPLYPARSCRPESAAYARWYTTNHPVAGAKLGGVASARMGVFQITGANTNEEFSAGGSFNTSSRQKKARITMRVEYRIK